MINVEGILGKEFHNIFIRKLAIEKITVRSVIRHPFKDALNDQNTRWLFIIDLKIQFASVQVIDCSNLFPAEYVF